MDSSHEGLATFRQGLQQVVRDCFVLAPDLLRFTASGPALLQGGLRGGECRNFVDLFIVFVFVNLALFCFYWKTQSLDIDIYDPELLAQEVVRVLGTFLQTLASKTPDIPYLASVTETISVAARAVGRVQTALGVETVLSSSIQAALKAYGVNDFFVSLLGPVSSSLKYVGLGPKTILSKTTKEKSIHYLRQYVAAFSTESMRSFFPTGTSIAAVLPAMVVWRSLFQSKTETSGMFVAFSGLMATACYFFPSTFLWARVGRKPPSTMQLLTLSTEYVGPREVPREVTRAMEDAELAAVRQHHRSGSVAPRKRI